MVSGDLKVLDQSYRLGNLCIGSMVLCLSAVVVMVTTIQVGVGWLGRRWWRVGRLDSLKTEYHMLY